MPKQSALQTKLIKWIGDDPSREALLISSVPVKASTLAKIKNGNYIPSERLANALALTMKGKS